MTDDETFSMEDVDIEAIAAEIDSRECEIRVARFNDMVTSGMAEDDAYAVLADEAILEGAVEAPRSASHHIDIYAIRMLRMSSHFARR